MRPVLSIDLLESRLEQPEGAKKAAGTRHQNGCRMCTRHVAEKNPIMLFAGKWMGLVFGKQLDTGRRVSWNFSHMGP